MLLCERRKEARGCHMPSSGEPRLCAWPHVEHILLLGLTWLVVAWRDVAHVLVIEETCDDEW